MGYDAQISRENPGCFLFLIDQSGSMAENVPGPEKRTKSQGVSEAINRLLQTISIKCTKDDEIRNYFDIGVLYYKGNKEVGNAFGSLAGSDFLIPIRTVADNPKRVDKVKKKEYLGAGENIEIEVKMPIWFDPVQDGGTPMCNALRQAHQILEGWVQTHPESFPPIVINITDGEATDGDPEPEVEKIKGLTTNDGNVLVFNCHISSLAAHPVMFPEDENSLPPDKFAAPLFRMSSVLPGKIMVEAQNQKYAVGELSRGFAFNINLAELVTFLDIGTRVARDAAAEEEQ